MYIMCAMIKSEAEYKVRYRMLNYPTKEEQIIYYVHVHVNVSTGVYIHYMYMYVYVYMYMYICTLYIVL